METRNTFASLLICYLFCLYVESIPNGEYITIKDAPFFVSLPYDDDHRSICGGSIISEYWILTAAHCIKPSEDIPEFVCIGESINQSNRSLYKVEKRIRHDGYSDSVHLSDNDIGLIKLKDPITFNEYQQPIKISRNPLKVGEKLAVYGLGRRNDIVPRTPNLRKTEMEVISHETCKELAKETTVKESVFCFKNAESRVCSGDSGGPAVVNSTVVGLASWARTLCWHFNDRNQTLAVGYTDVHQFYDWIRNKTGLEF